MARVQSTLALNDQMSKVLQRVNKAMNLTLNSFEAVQRASGRSFNTANIAAARREIGAADAALNEMEQSYRDCNNQQQQLNKHIGQGTTAAGGLLGKIKSIASAYLGMKAVKGLVGLSDTITQTDARLSMMNDGLQTTAELNDMIYASAQRSRGSYLATADAVAKLGLMAGDAFSSNKETIAFMEQVNKQFKIAGTSAQGIDAAMLQLTQAMGSGVLRGEEYNSILEQAPNIIQAIAKYMDVPKGKLKDMAADGQITADIVKAAMFACADETNAKFESMPKTWSDIWTSMKNRAIKALDPVLKKINKLANDPKVQQTVDRILQTFSTMAQVLMQVFEWVCSIYNFISDNWGWIGPIIWGIVGALLLYKGAVLAITAVETTAAIVKGVLAAVQAIQTVATFAATAAQYGLNAALLACPITWIIIGIILIIAAIYMVVNAVNKAKGTSISATGIIFGAFAVLGSHLINRFVIPLWNKFAALANFFGNVFSNPVASIKILFYDMCLTVIGYIRNLAHAIENLINKIPGIEVNITSGLDGFYSKLENARKKVKDESGWVEYVKKMDYIDYNTAFNKGYSAGKGVDTAIGGFVDKITDMLDYGDKLDNIANNTGDTAKNTDKSSEELSYLRDIAEREAINRFTTAEVRVELGGVTNNVTSSTDLDGVISYLADGLSEALVTAAEGVY